jgi:hypothetical protein
MSSITRIGQENIDFLLLLMIVIITVTIRATTTAWSLFLEREKIKAWTQAPHAMYSHALFEIVHFE